MEVKGAKEAGAGVGADEGIAEAGSNERDVKEEGDG